MSRLSFAEKLAELIRKARDAGLHPADVVAELDAMARAMFPDED